MRNKKNPYHLLFVVIFIFVFSCSRKNYYVSENFSEKTENHKIVAILPAEIILTGKLPKNITPEAIAKSEETESIDFQYALFNSILRHANTRRYITTVNFQDISTTQKILEKNNISIRDSWKMIDNELAKLLGADAILRMRIKKDRKMSDEASYGIDVAKQVIYDVGGRIPLPRSSVDKTYDIYASCNLISDNQTLWNDNYRRYANWNTPANVIIEWITDDFGTHFPYKERRNRR